MAQKKEREGEINKKLDSHIDLEELIFFLYFKERKWRKNRSRKRRNKEIEHCLSLS